MWQFFTERARRVIQLAHREALRLGHDIIGTEHILLGLLVEGDGVAAHVLTSLGIDLDEVRRRVEQLVGKGQPKEKPVDLPLSPRAKRVLDLAMREARNMGVNYVGTEHILLGLLAEGEGIAAQVLMSMGLDMQKVYQEVVRYLSGGDVDQITQPGLSKKRTRTKTPTLDQLGIDLVEMAPKRQHGTGDGGGDVIQGVGQIYTG